MSFCTVPACVSLILLSSSACFLLFSVFVSCCLCSSSSFFLSFYLYKSLAILASLAICACACMLATTIVSWVTVVIIVFTVWSNNGSETLVYVICESVFKASGISMSIAASCTGWVVVGFAISAYDCLVCVVVVVRCLGIYCLAW